MRPITFAAAATLAVALAGAPALAQSPQSLSADVIDTDGTSIGTVTFTETASGVLHIVADVSGIAPGVHGFHVHEVGECDPADGFKSAGGHYAVGHEHGILVEGGPHPGDLPNVHVGEDGLFQVELFDTNLTLTGGEAPLTDADGSAVVIYADPDDYESQPSGAAGDRIACGVIE